MELVYAVGQLLPCQRVKVDMQPLDLQEAEEPETSGRDLSKEGQYQTKDIQQQESDSPQDASVSHFGEDGWEEDAFQEAHFTDGSPQEDDDKLTGPGSSIAVPETESRGPANGHGPQEEESGLVGEIDPSEDGWSDDFQEADSDMAQEASEEPPTAGDHTTKEGPVQKEPAEDTALTAGEVHTAEVAEAEFGYSLEGGGANAKGPNTAPSSPGELEPPPMPLQLYEGEEPIVYQEEAAEAGAEPGEAEFQEPREGAAVSQGPDNSDLESVTAPLDKDHAQCSAPANGDQSEAAVEAREGETGSREACESRDYVEDAAEARKSEAEGSDDEWGGSDAWGEPAFQEATASNNQANGDVAPGSVSEAAHSQTHGVLPPDKGPGGSEEMAEQRPDSGNAVSGHMLQESQPAEDDQLAEGRGTSTEVSSTAVEEALSLPVSPELKLAREACLQVNLQSSCLTGSEFTYRLNWAGAELLIMSASILITVAFSSCFNASIT